MTWQYERSALTLTEHMISLRRCESSHCPVRPPRALQFRDEERNAFLDRP